MSRPTTRFLIEVLFQNNLKFLIITLILSMLLYYTTVLFNFQNLLKNFSIIYLVRFILVSSLLVSFFIHCYVFWLYLNFLTDKINTGVYLQSGTRVYWGGDKEISFVINKFYSFSLELFGLVFILLAYLVGVISLLALDTRLY